MAKPTGFLEHKRKGVSYRPAETRTGDFKQVMLEIPEEDLKAQASRCMDCGVPFCSNPNSGRGGCPLGNVIPDWNDLVYRGKWEEAISRLHSTNNFPEFTGSICPAPCESGCVLGVAVLKVDADRHLGDACQELAVGEFLIEGRQSIRFGQGNGESGTRGGERLKSQALKQLR